MPYRHTTTVIDAGGRYGLHPTWKPFQGELAYYLFEADQAEAARLVEKYAHRSDEIKVVNRAVAQHDGKLEIRFLKNRAMSGSVERKPISSLFKGERLEQVDVTDVVQVDAVSIDSFSKLNNIAIDFLKLDTEGTEYAVLQGASEQLRSSILGVRSEVAFDYIFDGCPLFGEINALLLDHGYYLLNMDYDGRGDNQNDFVRIPGRYGILTSTDAVWLRRPQFVFSKSDTDVKVLKYAAFCLNNSAADVAIDILMQFRRLSDFGDVRSSKLYRYVDISIQKHFYALKWQPGQTLKGCSDAYQAIFGKHMKEMNAFMESRELNPD